MTYDHHEKAGNAGDIIKHVALIAALNANNNKRSTLEFVDLFAGYAFNPIVKGNRWNSGIDRIHGQPLYANDSDVRLYLKWYLSRPTLEGGIYPGSSLIAHDVMAYQGNKIKLTLFDIQEKPIQNLNLIFGNQEHSIYHRAASIKDTEVATADFMFIDPPGLHSADKPEYPKLNHLIEFTTVPVNCQTLFWLPIIRSSDNQALTESLETSNAIRILNEHGFDITKVVWSIKGNTIGCFLAYKLDMNGKKRLRSAVEDMFYIAEWYREDNAYIKHIDARNS